MFNKSCLQFLNRSSTRYVNLKTKHKDSHWSVQVKKKNATGRALEHFDDFYNSVYGKSFPSIRHGLIAEHHKYVAVLNNFSDSEKVAAKLENTGALNMRTLFNLEKKRNPYLNPKDDVNTISENKRVAQASTRELITSYSKGEEILRMNSVSEGLKTAEIDTSRIISPGVTDLTSALYEFVPATKLKGREDWILETQHYRYYENANDEFKVKIEKEYDLHFPEYLNVYCYEKSNHTAFASPRRGVTGVFDYYLLDGGSVLPVLALGLKKGDRFLDMCAAPGGKTYIALQTLYPEFIVCNDSEASRVKRIHQVMREYLYDLDERWLATNRLRIMQEDARGISFDGFDCILVDVPCTNDRLSVKENDNNWFKPTRTKERLQLPETQAAILSNALKLIQVGGTVVYSTCSLSPIQNDGVVNMALRCIWEETNIQLIVKDLAPALQPAQCVFKFADQSLLRFGHLVVPYLPQNYGPTYFCKIQRVA